MFTTGYGQLAVAATVLVAASWAVDVAMLIRRGREMRRLGPVSAAATSVLLTVALAVVSAMATRVAPGLLAHKFTAWDVLLGYQLPGPPNALRLATVWRFDPLIGVAAILAAIVYLVGVSAAAQAW